MDNIKNLMFQGSLMPDESVQTPKASNTTTSAVEIYDKESRTPAFSNSKSIEPVL